MKHLKLANTNHLVTYLETLLMTIDEGSLKLTVLKFISNFLMKCS